MIKEALLILSLKYIHLIKIKILLKIHCERGVSGGCMPTASHQVFQEKTIYLEVTVGED